MSLANFNLVNSCAPHVITLRTITREITRARVFGGINFGDLAKNLPIRQIKIPAKVSRYKVVHCKTGKKHLLAMNTGGLIP